MLHHCIPLTPEGLLDTLGRRVEGRAEVRHGDSDFFIRTLDGGIVRVIEGIIVVQPVWGECESDNSREGVGRGD
jgi:hypothetical protein